VDVNLFVILLVAALILTLLGFLGKTPTWAMLPFFGGVVAVYWALALLADGNLTEVSGGTTSTLAAANGNIVSDFSALSIIPIAITLAAFTITIRRAFKI
jgi:hypothetical protein